MVLPAGLALLVREYIGENPTVGHSLSESSDRSPIFKN